MRLAEALRELLLTTDDRAYRTSQDQARVTEAHRALAEWDQTIASIRRTQARGTDSHQAQQDGEGGEP